MSHRPRNTVRRYVVALAAAAMACGLVFNGNSQTPSLESKLRQEQRPHAPVTSKRVHEAEEVRILVPPGWKVLKVGHPDDPLVARPPAVPQTFIPALGNGLLLTKSGYVLTLAYRAGHASGITGGRFIEVLNIPWLLDISDVWDCSGYLRRNPQPVSRELLFVNLILEPSDSEVREKCGIPKDLVFERRWFAGYFTTGEGGWFFKSEGANCAQKAYTLTTGARTPDELPIADDPSLQKIIQEAIDIVASIQYNHCPPAGRSDPLMLEQL